MHQNDLMESVDLRLFELSFLDDSLSSSPPFRGYIISNRALRGYFYLPVILFSIMVDVVQAERIKKVLIVNGTILVHPNNPFGRKEAFPIF